MNFWVVLPDGSVHEVSRGSWSEVRSLCPDAVSILPTTEVEAIIVARLLEEPEGSA
jgi:hypothetical protein